MRPVLRVTGVLAGAGAAVALALQLNLSAQTLSLLDAVKAGNHEAFRAALAGHPNPDMRDPDGTTALHWAARGGDIEVVRALLHAGAHVNTANQYGITPLSLAAANGDGATAAELVAAGADVNASTPGGETVLMTAAHTGNPTVVVLLLEHGADVSAREHEFGETALMWAAAENHAAVITQLADYGADVNARAKVLQFPNVKVDAATMVITALPKGGLTALMYAARQGSAGAARALIDAGASLNASDPDGMSALVIAIINAHYDVAQLLTARGADPNAGDVTGMAAVYAAVDMHTLDPLVNRPPPPGNTSHGMVDLVSALLEHRANPNAILKSPLLARQHNFGDPALGAGATPLMRAAKNGDVEMMDVLIAHGADVRQAMPNGMTPLLFAVSPSRRKLAREAIAAATLCLNHGADVNAPDSSGSTALHLAVATSDDVVAFLVERGAPLDARDQFGRTPLDVAMGVAGGAARGRGAAPVVRESTVSLLRGLAARGPSPR